MRLTNFDRHFVPPVAGFDEVGLGAIAGPVVCACVILPRDRSLMLAIEDAGVNDSKKLTQTTRERLYPLITEHAAHWEILEEAPWRLVKGDMGWTVRSLYEALAASAIARHGAKSLLFDGKPLEHFAFKHHAYVRGDGRSLSIAAASVIAKVHRDRLMVELAEQYPHYCWDQNKGYPTKSHLAGLDTHGPSRWHRKETGPVKRALTSSPPHCRPCGNRRGDVFHWTE